jgi:hypothetical protein
MADIIDIDVFQTVTSVSFEVEPNTNIININKVTGGGGGVGGATNLSTSQTATDFTINSDTGDDALVPLGNGTLAGATLNNYTTAEKNKLAAITGTNTGDQNLQSVTNLGANTTNAIYAQISGISNAITGESTLGKGIFGLSVEAAAVEGGSISGIGVNGYSSTGIGVQGYSEEGVGGSFDTDSSTANITNFKKSGIVKASINNAGELTAQKLIKQGGFDYQFLKADGSVDNNIYLTSDDLPSTLDLYATTTASDISGYTVLVRNISDTRYNTIAENVSTGVITSIAQLVGSLVTDANIISGNPGVFDFKTIGNISRTSGTGQAEFFFRIYKRNLAGTETLIAQSDYTLPVTNGGYVEFSATALWNDGIFLDTDRVVLKYYANRLASPVGSDPTYQFQFGGTSPVRSSAAIPTSVMPNIYLRDLADVENVDALNNEILYWNDPASLWEHELAENLVPLATATQKGLVSTTTQTIAGAKTFTDAISASNLSGTNTGDNATNTQYSGLAASKQDTITLTTTGTSGASTLVGATLNIPQYSGATNLGYTAAPTNGTVTSSTGTSATLPLADATNAGLLKPAKFTVLENTSGTNTGDQNLSGYALLASPTFTGTPSLPTGTIGVTQTAGDNSTKLATTAFVSTAVAAGGVTVSGQDTFGTANIATVTAAQYAGFVTAETVSTTTLYFITA